MSGLKLPISLEFFPPKTPEGADKLRGVRQALYGLKPEFCSVTYGAGGSTQEGTFATVGAILAEGVPAASHFSCIGATKASVRAELATLKAMGVKRLVALRGDLPSGYGAGGEFHYASDLVSFIRAEMGDDFHIEVAAYPEIHPQAKSPDADLQAFATKVLPGIMPITSSSQLLRFSDACGAEIPRWIRLRLQSYGDDTDSIKAFGLDVVSDLCEQLINGGVPAIHFYTMNQSAATLAVLQRLKALAH
jgi:methylenetetrahydrofolate reductase (NADPH)